MEATTVQRQKPEIHLGWPAWWHQHGLKMKVEQLDLENRVLVISGSAAKVTIQRASSVITDATEWFVDWEVVQIRPWEVGTRGRAWFKGEDLEAAFGLSDDSDESGDWLIKRFGGDSANQGRYIRWERFLNIPCPGTGHDGDPNVSIEVKEEIKNAVRQLLT